MEIEYRTQLPNISQFFALFDTTGWNREYQASADELACMLANSQFVVSAYDGNHLVGFGRIVTDGILHAMIYDMIVHPGYRGLGIGTRILQLLVQWCRNSHIRDIQLFCASGKRPFYEKAGFVARLEDAPGMQYQSNMKFERIIV